MKFFITLTASTMLMFNNLSAQTLDTISIGAGYTQQVWYKLETDVETKKSNLDWDLAFSTRIQRDAAINTNPFATNLRVSMDTFAQSAAGAMAL